MPLKIQWMKLVTCLPSSWLMTLFSVSTPAATLLISGNSLTCMFLLITYFWYVLLPPLVLSVLISSGLMASGTLIWSLPPSLSISSFLWAISESLWLKESGASGESFYTSLLFSFAVLCSSKSVSISSQWTTVIQTEKTYNSTAKLKN